MGPNLGDNAATEKPEVKKPTTPAPKPDKAGVGSNEKETLGETLPGWTIMRPLRMRGLKGKGSGRAPFKEIVDSNVSPNGRGIDGNGSKSNSDLKVTETNATNGSGDGRGGIGEVETLHEIRSDDELLGSDAEEDAPRRITPDRGEEDNTGDDGTISSSEIEFKVYKRRWFGLVQLVLLNIIVSWDVSVQCNLQQASHNLADVQ